MKRTQVYFDEVDYQLIEALAAQKRVKRAEMIRLVVREGTRQLLKRKERGRKSAGEALANIARMAVKGPRNLSKNIDAHLYGRYSQYARK